MEGKETDRTGVVSPALVRKIWGGLTMPIGADISANWQDITFLMRDGDRTAEGALTQAASKRIAASLSSMVVRRMQVLEDPGLADAFTQHFTPAARTPEGSR